MLTVVTGQPVQRFIPTGRDTVSRVLRPEAVHTFSHAAARAAVAASPETGLIFRT